MVPDIRPKFLSWSALKESPLLAHKLHSGVCPPVVRDIDRGAILWNLSGDNNDVSKPKHTLLPVLTVLFLVSYGLLTMLVVEQGRTIDSQRSLIRLLFDDSVQLSSLKGKAFQKQQAEAQAQAQKKAPPAHTTQRDSQVQTPATSRADAKNHSTSKLRRPLPQKPPKDTSDEADERRTLISI